ncbi:MAG: hypothetical protein HDKAJFGB_02711 [Anaerolineae bacterium]|nr:hypothetical protein [Anaerolineae bacterium]
MILPTTLNATALDLRHPDAWGYSALWKSKAQRMANAYVSMGCTPTWTCAPYQTEYLPKFGQQIAWAESNAIVYANSVISARGSSTGSGILLAAIRLGNAPAAMILKRRDAILALGALMSRELYGKTMPLVVVSESEFAGLHKAKGARGTETGQVEWEFRETH